MSTLSKGSESSQEQKTTLKNFDFDIGTIPIINNTPLHQKLDLVGEIELKPGEQRRIFLGNFTKEDSPKGFSVGFVPDPDPAGSMITEVNCLGTVNSYKLIMHAANYGMRAIKMEVRRLN